MSERLEEARKTDVPGPAAAELQRLRRAIDASEVERERLIRRRRREILLLGILLSVVVHAALMLYLNALHRRAPSGRGVEPVSLQFAVLQEQELTELTDTDLDDVVPEIVPEFDPLPDVASETLDARIPVAALEVASSGSMPTLGGAGDGSGGVQGLGGGGAGTSFFGVSSTGTRFAYIVDVSGSMGQNRKIQVAMRELARSIEGLPDFASFYIVLFSSNAQEPPMQRGWSRARRSTIRAFIRWLSDVDPGGGTQPRSAFDLVFDLPERPDVIFFLTDGQIADFTAEELAAKNRGGKRVVVNTIAFGDPSSQDLLRAIADQTGGVYRFVPTEGR